MIRGACQLCGCRRVLFDVSDQYSAAPGVSFMCGECCEGARRTGDLYFAFPTPLAVRALRVAGRDLAEWELWWQPAGAIGWRVACLAYDAGDVFAVR